MMSRWHPARQGHGADGRIGRRQDHHPAPHRRPEPGARRASCCSTGRTSRTSATARACMRAPSHGHAVPVRRAVRRHERCSTTWPFRCASTPTCRSADPRHRADEAQCGRAARARPDAQRSVGRHGAPRALARTIALDPNWSCTTSRSSGLDPISLARRRGSSANSTTPWADQHLLSHELERLSRIADHVIILANGGWPPGHARTSARATDPLVVQFVNALPDGPVRFHYPAPPGRTVRPGRGRDAPVGA